MDYFLFKSIPTVHFFYSWQNKLQKLVWLFISFHVYVNCSLQNMKEPFWLTGSCYLMIQPPCPPAGQSSCAAWGHPSGHSPGKPCCWPTPPRSTWPRLLHRAAPWGLLHGSAFLLTVKGKGRSLVKDICKQKTPHKKLLAFEEQMAALGLHYRTQLDFAQSLTEFSLTQHCL